MKITFWSVFSLSKWLCKYFFQPTSYSIGLICILPFVQLFSQESGETIFKTTCAVCHTIGGGKIIGPDLKNVQDRHPEDWLARFIRSSKTVIDSGDKYADSIFQAYNKVLMPDQPNITDAQIKELLAYIKTNSSGDVAANQSKTPAKTGDVERGKKLFVGNIRFANRGASCNSCHNVEIQGYLSGGALGKDLTHVVSRLTASGVSAVISGLPFPQMKETYDLHPITEQEVADLTAFLQEADKAAPATFTSNIGIYVLTGGVVGLFILLWLYSNFWTKRKKGPVYSAVFNRQIRST